MLECGHAIPSRYKHRGNGVLMSTGRACILCNRYPPNKKAVAALESMSTEAVQAAILEGKRRRAILYYLERQKEVPSQLLKVIYYMALFESPDSALPSQVYEDLIY